MTKGLGSFNPLTSTLKSGPLVTAPSTCSRQSRIKPAVRDAQHRAHDAAQIRATRQRRSCACNYGAVSGKGTLTRSATG